MLGAVQGLTEFIPVSSSGHLVVIPEALGWAPPGLAFDVLLHLGSLIALLVYFSGDLLDLARGATKDPSSRRLIFLLIVTNIPAAAVGLLLEGYVEKTFTDARAAALQLVATGAILVAAEVALAYHVRRASLSGTSLRGLDELGLPGAGLIGVAQAVAILPGISRSGSMIGAGVAVGLNRSDAARFALLVAIPALAGASLLEVPELGGSRLGAGAGIAGLVTSLVASYAAIFALLRFLTSHTLYPFAVYCALAGVAFYLIL